jgi:hypothetical protein
VVDKSDPLMTKLGQGERWLAGAAGILALIVSGGLTVWTAMSDKTVNSVGVGSLFAISLVLLVLTVAGRLPANVSVTNSGFDVGFVSGAAAGAEKATEKAKEQITATIAEGRADLEERFSQAQTPEDVKPVLDDMMRQIHDKVITPTVSELIPPS